MNEENHTRNVTNYLLEGQDIWKVCREAITTLIGILIILGNGLVLYAGYGNKNLFRMAALQNERISELTVLH